MTPKPGLNEEIMQIYKELTDHVDEIVRLRKMILSIRLLIHIMVILNIILASIIIFT